MSEDQKKQFDETWKGILRCPYPKGCYRTIVDRQELVLVDYDLGACVSWFRAYIDDGTIPQRWVTFLEESIALLDKIVTETKEECASYFSQWRDLVIYMRLRLQEDENLVIT